MNSHAFQQMKSMIPISQWQPISVDEVWQIFTGAPFAWGLAGGYAMEQFLGRSIREHGDIDIVVFRDDQLKLQRWLTDWRLYAVDPPKHLRRWHADEYLAFGIHDIWCHKEGASSWQVQVMLAEVDGREWFSRRNPRVRGKREDLFATYNGISCVRVEVLLLYKSRDIRQKDTLDFQACLPFMGEEARVWLADQLSLCYPQGHGWLGSLL
jgi:hypothetical protein